MKKLPKIYQNEITKKINNNKTVCYLKEKPLDPYTGIPTILEKIDQVFSGYGWCGELFRTLLF